MMINDSFAANHSPDDVLRLRDAEVQSLSALLAVFGLSLKIIASGDVIPGSFWGEEEAGLICNELLARPDTPLHSILHEACHFVCMDETRRNNIHTDAGGDYDEENAVCYLQILLSDRVDGFGRLRMFEDMDRWGYSFRLGSARAWFENDADDARTWLLQNNLIDRKQQPSWQLRRD